MALVESVENIQFFYHHSSLLLVQCTFKRNLKLMGLALLLYLTISIYIFGNHMKYFAFIYKHVSYIRWIMNDFKNFLQELHEIDESIEIC
jgi:hypothetical protein